MRHRCGKRCKSGRSALISRAVVSGAAVLLGVVTSSLPLEQSVSASPSRAAVKTHAAAKAGTSISRPDCAANRAAGTLTYVSPFGFDATVGIIDVFAAQRLGYFKDLCVTVQFVTKSTDSTALVSAGTATTTNVGSASTFLSAVASGADITAVATYGDTSDTCIVTRPTITDLKQLEGKTYGYHFTQNPAVLAMLKRAGVDTAKITMVDIGADYDPLEEYKTVDAFHCYQTNEPLTLRDAGVKFNEFTPAQFGVTGTYNVEFFNTKFLRDHYVTAEDWMRADLHAVGYCSQHEARCISIEEGYAKAAGATYTVAHESQVWSAAVQLATRNTLPGEGTGVESQAEWRSAVTEVATYHLVKKMPTLAKVENTTMVASLYDGKTLIWP